SEDGAIVDRRLTRDCFLYLSPRPPVDTFAQCGTCKMWTADNLCTIHGPEIPVVAEMSCGLYVNGQPLPKGTETAARVLPIESGLVNREVRCENCKWGGPKASAAGDDWANSVVAGGSWLLAKFTKSALEQRSI